MKKFDEDVYPEESEEARHEKWSTCKNLELCSEKAADAFARVFGWDWEDCGETSDILKTDTMDELKGGGKVDAKDMYELLLSISLLERAEKVFQWAYHLPPDWHGDMKDYPLNR